MNHGNVNKKKTGQHTQQQKETAENLNKHCVNVVKKYGSKMQPISNINVVRKRDISTDVNEVTAII